jgi:hypothetical protein
VTGFVHPARAAGAYAGAKEREEEVYQWTLPRITLDIPDPENIEDDEPHVYISVPANVVDYGIELLQCFVMQWKLNSGSEADHRVWHPLAISAAQMLSGLMGTYAAYYHENNAHLLVEQIAWFCDHSPHAPEALEAVRTADNADIVDALLALHAPRERRRKERLQLRIASQQRPVADHDARWDF